MQSKTLLTYNISDAKIANLQQLYKLQPALYHICYNVYEVGFVIRGFCL